MSEDIGQATVSDAGRVSDDFALTKICADAMGLTVHPFPPNNIHHYWRIRYRHGSEDYDPLHNDAQNSALDDVLLANGHYEVKPWALLFFGRGVVDDCRIHADMLVPANRRRARVECVAKIHRPAPDLVQPPDSQQAK